MTKEEYWYWLCNIPGIWQQNIKRLLDRFKSPEGIFTASPDALSECTFLSEKDAANIRKAQQNPNVKESLEKLSRAGIRFVHAEHPAYPERFRVLEDMPYGFYYKGSLPDPAVYAVGMVGARACSGYGKEMAWKFSSSLAANNVQIISGMAYGIDAICSEGALKAGGKTFVVLGTGVDVIYPLENMDLYYRILDAGGGVLSEYPPGTKGNPWRFPHRNRLISALSDKLLIMEARSRSGTLTTAQHALLQGVDIWALPGRINDPLSEGCNRLIADGCGILLSPKDFYMDLVSRPVRMFPGGKESAAEGSRKARRAVESRRENTPAGYKDISAQENVLQDVSAAAALLYSFLECDPQTFDALIKKSGFSVDAAAAALSELEICGYAAENAKDMYSKKCC